MAAKRPAPDASGGPPAKKISLVFSPLDIGPAGGEEDLNIKVLQVQNRKLSDRLRERNRHQEELERRKEQLEEEQKKHQRMTSSLKNHLTTLGTHLQVALTAVGLTEGRHNVPIVSNQSLNSVEMMDGVFDNLFSSILKMGQAGGQRLMQEIKDQDEDKLSSLVHNQSLALSRLEELCGQPAESEVRSLKNAVSALETRCEELDNSLAESRFDLQKSQTRGDRLEKKLQEALENLQMMPTFQSQPSEESTNVDDGKDGSSSSSGCVAGGGVSNEDKTITADEVEQLHSDLSDSQAIAESRLNEITDLSNEVAELKKEINQLKLAHQKVPESAILESPTYKSLQSHYSIVVQEAGQVRACLEEAKQLLNSAKQQHFVQLEEIRGEELKYQMEVREEMNQLETALFSAKRDYELLRIDFERTMASNEQAAPIAKELQVTVDSLQKTIQQLKSEATRYKSRAHKAEQQVAKAQEDKERSDSTSSSSVTIRDQPSVTDEVKNVQSADVVDRSEFNELNKKLLKLSEEKAVVEGKLECLKQASSPEEREKAEIIVAEKKARNQVEELKRKFEEYRKDYEKRKEHIREEASRKSKALTEDNKHLQKDLAAKKQEAQALVSEMECTAQAFEEMQEQNIRLLQQLKEKDDANFKLMSERIKSNSVQKLLLEEKELLQTQLTAMATESQRLSEVISQLDERERNSEATLQSVDKELTLKQQAIELHKRKALESVLSLQEAQLKIEEVERLTQNTEKTLQGKTEECEQENQSFKRVQEEIGGLKKKLEKYKSREWMNSSDEVLLEEIKTYKAKLNCPCCSTRKKDTVLTKCFHVFCSECIKNRYDSRLRKCPKCGAAFGANDFHKLYLS